MGAEFGAVMHELGAVICRGRRIGREGVWHGGWKFSILDYKLQGLCWITTDSTSKVVAVLVTGDDLKHPKMNLKDRKSPFYAKKNF